jgi:hypothetical protein
MYFMGPMTMWTAERRSLFDNRAECEAQRFGRPVFLMLGIVL